jgi:N-acetyl-gamma-glutamyl-phosphate reductase
MSIRVGIIGGAGYTGGELLRILLRHPGARVAYVHSRSQAGSPVAKVHTDLLGDTDLVFTAELPAEVDLLFLCLGHGESRNWLSKHPLPSSVRIIDLSQDFRLTADSCTDSHQFVYGLPELNREAIRSAEAVANPGCFATAIQLGLLPLARRGWLAGEVYITGITGSTGAGQALTPTSQFSWRANNIQAYKTLNHQHLGEIGQSFGQLGGLAAIHFVPWRGDFTRGIFVSSTLDCSQAPEALHVLYREYYAAHPFTHLSEESISLKQVVNTNKALVQLERQGDKLVVHTAIDNLLKGASGQAVQNMNLLFGLPETEGLHLKSSYF